ncbi:MAG: hypothetical protein IKD72_05310 [Clostridia bacterium]|nr:hypothetical protein [Clostridia bacterium]
MNAKKILSFLLSVVLILGAASVLASANTYEGEIVENAVNHYDLAAGDIFKCTFSGKGKYGIITIGNAKPKIVISTKNGQSKELKTGADGNILDTYEFGLLNFFPKDYTINISAKDGKACAFDLYFFNIAKTTCGFISQPTSNKVYVEDIDFTADELKDVYKARFDFTGARFIFRDTDGTEILAFKDDEVKQVLNPVAVYAGSTITYTSKYASHDIFKVLFGANQDTADYVTFRAQPNPIKSVQMIAKPDGAFTYQYGTTDGTIKGTILKYYFIPELKFDGVVFKVRFKDYVYALKDDIRTEYPVQKDANGYYIDLELFGKQYIKWDAPKIESNKDQTIQVEVRVGGCKYQQDVTIKKAGFFDMVIIWFGVLFGKYR